MTIDDFKEIIALKNELKHIQERIRVHDSAIRSPRSLIYGGTSCYGAKDPTPAVQRYVEYKDKMQRLYRNQESELFGKIEKAEEVIAQMPVGCRELMRLRYIDGFRWAKVNKILGIGGTKSKALHAAAVEFLEKKTICDQSATSERP